MKKLLLILLIAPFLTLHAHAEGYAGLAATELEAESVKESLPEDLKDLGEGLTLDGDFDGVGALERLWDRFLEAAVDSFRACAKEAAALLGLTIVCSLAGIVAPGDRQREQIQIGGCAAASLLLTNGMNSMIGEATSALHTLSDYACGALPAIYTAAAACGMPISASARYGVACLALDLMMAAAERLILPLLYGMIAFSVCSCFYDNPLLKAGLKLVKKTCTLLLSGLCLTFSGLITVTGIVAGSTDAAAVKTTKTVISAAVPVVGRILSDAASSFLSAAGVVRNAAGAFGLVAVCAICCAPFAELLVRRLLFSLVSAAAELMFTDRQSRLLADLGGVIGRMLGMVASFGLMLFVSIASAIRSVTV